MTIDIQASIKRLAQGFKEKGFELYIVGGFVRNTLMGLPHTDIDCCSGAPIALALEIATESGFEAVLRDDTLGTLAIKTENDTIEYTQFRCESYVEGRHRPSSVCFTQDMLPDALRRDFTVNAIYASAFDGEITDPLGALADLNAGILRACRPDAIETLKDDGLRLLRLARFCGELGLEPEIGLTAAAQKYASNINDIARERISAEFLKICLADIKYPQITKDTSGHYRAMLMLAKIGVLKILIPELFEGVDIEQKKAYHRYDVYEHALHTFEQSAPYADIRLAALLHDIAKPRCASKNNGRMYGHESLGSSMAEEILHRLGINNRLIKDVCRLIFFHMYDLKGQAKTSTLRKRFAQWGFGFTRKLILLRKADIAGSGIQKNDDVAFRWEELLDTMQKEGAIDDMRKLAVNGEDIINALGISPGEEVGRIKMALFMMAAIDPSINTKERLLKEALNISNQPNIFK